MSERLIVVEHCRDCPDSTFGFLRGRRRVCAMMLPEEHICPDAGTPDWCPLPKLPDKKHIDPRVFDLYERGEVYGWNSCLIAITDEILGEEEE